MAQPNPLRAYVQVQTTYDAQYAKLLEATADDIAHRVERLGTGVGGQVRRAQLTATMAQIRSLQNEMWKGTGGVQDITMAGRLAGALKANEVASAYLAGVANRALPGGAAKALVDGLESAAAAGIRVDGVRVPRTLSTAVYDNAALSTGKVEQIIRSGIISNLSAREIASDVRGFISPGVAGGESYAALRLGRTEINNAYHAQQIAGASRPGVKAVIWNLSGSHPKPDKCNDYAQHRRYRPEDVPGKPHPQCLCFLTYDMMSPGEFNAALRNGSFDDEIDRRTAINLSRKGVKVDAAEAPEAEIKSIGSKGKVPKADYTRGSNITEEVMDDWENINKYEAGKPDSIDTKLTKIAQRQGWNDKVRVVNTEEFEAAIDAGAPELYRGVKPYKKTHTAEQVLDELRGKGEFNYGTGIYGNGIYFSVDADTSFSFAVKRGVKDPNQNVIRATISPDAKVIDYDDLMERHSKWMKEFEQRPENVRAENSSDFEEVKRYRQQWSMMQDPGRWAASQGYDVIRITDKDDGFSKTEQYNVINRSALLIENVSLRDLIDKGLHRDVRSRVDQITEEQGHLGGSYKVPTPERGTRRWK